MNTLQACLRFTLSQEGAFSDDPNDSGGATEKGVTLAEYRTYLDKPGASVAMLKAITDAEIASIFRLNYYNPVHGDSLPPGVCLSATDFAFNAGPATSARIVQRCVGVSEDGAIGPVTLLAVKGMDPVMLISALYHAQSSYYRSLSAFTYFGNGWLARCAKRQIAALNLQTSGGIVPPLQIAQGVNEHQVKASGLNADELASLQGA